MKYLIWSEEHGAWWRPSSAGYTTSMKRAGVYSDAPAHRIVRSANGHGRFCETLVQLTPDIEHVRKLPGGGR